MNVIFLGAVLAVVNWYFFWHLFLPTCLNQSFERAIFYAGTGCLSVI